MKLTKEQKSKLVDTIIKAMRRSYPNIPKEQIMEEMPKVFKALKAGKEYEGDIILMFMQDDIKKVVDAGYEWGEDE